MLECGSTSDLTSQKFMSKCEAKENQFNIEHYTMLLYTCTVVNNRRIKKLIKKQITKYVLLSNETGISDNKMISIFYLFIFSYFFPL